MLKSVSKPQKAGEKNKFQKINTFTNKNKIRAIQRQNVLQLFDFLFFFVFVFFFYGKSHLCVRTQHV